MTAINPDDVKYALEVLELQLPVTRAQLDQKRRELLHIWNPHRYANLTNNPRKYMQMFKKGEAMTKEIEAASKVIAEWLAASDYGQS
ncbi:MAG: hypothetical protein ACT4OO_02535 [Nitrospiraceae bacterium]